MALATASRPETPKPNPLPFVQAQPPFREPLPRSLPTPPRFYLDGTPVDRVSLDYAAAWVIQALQRRNSHQPLLIMGPNAQLVTLAARQPRFAAALRLANLAVPDGISVVLAARLLGQPVPERVTAGNSWSASAPRPCVTISPSFSSADFSEPRK